jgi:hypothetical protein
VSITVSGKLDFNQTLTLIYSKLFSKNSSKDAEALNARDYVLLQREIINGVLTLDILQTIRSVCSSKEKNSFFKLHVISPLIYKKSRQCSTPQVWCDKVLEKQ